MSPLHKALQSWRGPDSILRMLRQAGYDAHSVYRDFIAGFCKSRCLSADISEYWQETAKEYMSSAGGLFDLGKNRSVEGYYRSPYLERLRLQSQTIKSKFSVLPSIHPCVHAYMSEIEFGDRALYPKIRKTVEERKSFECMQQNVSGRKWTGSKRNFNLIVDDVAESLGLEILGNSAGRFDIGTLDYGFRASNGLCFYFRADNGVREPIRARLPIEFRIGYERVTNDDFFIADLRHIIPGIEQYGYFSTPESAVLGIHALIKAFRSLAGTF